MHIATAVFSRRRLFLFSDLVIRLCELANPWRSLTSGQSPEDRGRTVGRESPRDVPCPESRSGFAVGVTRFASWRRRFIAKPHLDDMGVGP